MRDKPNKRKEYGSFSDFQKANARGPRRQFKRPTEGQREQPPQSRPSSFRSNEQPQARYSPRPAFQPSPPRPFKSEQHQSDRPAPKIQPNQPRQFQRSAPPPRSQPSFQPKEQFQRRSVPPVNSRAPEMQVKPRKGIFPSKIFDVFEDGRGKLYTKNLTPGKSYFRENLVHFEGIEYREWDPKRSKLAAAILKGCTNTFIRKGSIILYLGAAHGYTPSFISDIIGKEGFIFAMDNAPRVVRDLVFLSKERENIAPILGDAFHPETYTDKATQVDIIYQDIAQRNQAEIFLKNIETFLKPGGHALIAVKARSIDVRRKPKDLFEEVRKQLEKSLTVIDFRTLDQLELDHCFIVCKKRG